MKVRRAKPAGGSKTKCSCWLISLTGTCLVILCQLVLFPTLLSIALGTQSQDTASSWGTTLFNLTQQQQTITQPTTTKTTTTTRRTKQRRSRPTETRTPDGTFNGGPMYLQTAKANELKSRVHCVGDNYQKKEAWKERSCRFELLCFNITKKDFVVFESLHDTHLAQHLSQREYIHVSSSMHRGNGTNSVSLGGINQKWGSKGIPRLQWFPYIWRIKETDTRQIQYYMLPESTVLIPYHSLNGANPGHLVWDDYLPMYTLLDMFDLLDEDDYYNVLPLRYVLQDGERGLWASCEVRDERTQLCNKMNQKFWPLMTGLPNPYHYTTTHSFDFVEHKKGQSNLVCAKTAVAGLGDLTDHGLHKAHGWEPADYKTVHNHGRGGQLYRFRNYMLRNIHMDTGPVDVEKPLRIVFSQMSSDIYIRKMDFAQQIAVVEKAFPEASVEKYIFKEHTVEEQVEIARNTAIYVTLCGGGAVTAMFLPKGSSVIVYFSEDGGTSNGKMNFKPAWLDWDLFNSMSHLRVHWMPRNTMKTGVDDEALVKLIRHELTLVKQQAFFG